MKCSIKKRYAEGFPNAPAPTKPIHVVTRAELQEAAHWLRVAQDRKKNPHRFVKETKLMRKCFDERKEVANKKHAIVIAMAMDGRSSEEIAEAVGYSYKTVEGVIYLARKRGKDIPRRSRWKK